MTTRYEWTPASEPPDSHRLILTYGYDVDRPTEPYWCEWVYVPTMEWDDNSKFVVTHWRDVKLPEEA